MERDIMEVLLTEEQINSVVAGGQTPETPDTPEIPETPSNLVLHYDFAGKTQSEILSNKVNSEGEKLIAANNSSNGMVFADGIVTNKNVGSADGSRAYLYYQTPTTVCSLTQRVQTWLIISR